MVRQRCEDCAARADPLSDQMCQSYLSDMPIIVFLSDRVSIKSFVIDLNSILLLYLDKTILMVFNTFGKFECLYLD